MNVALRRPTMTLEEFLEWEELQPSKHEFDGFGPVATNGGSAGHAAIQCPNAFVVCTPLPPRTTVVSEPVVVFEVLSESTAATDSTSKNRECRDTPFIRRYVVVQQTAAGCTISTHRGGEWATDVLVGTDAILAMPEIGCEIPLSEMYDGVGSLPAEPLGG